MSKVISIGLYGNQSVYVINSLINAIIYKIIYPGWILRFYYYNVPDAIIECLRSKDCQLILVEPENKDHEILKIMSMFWRFRVMDDPDVSHFIIRDADSILGDREYVAVNKWIESGKAIHLIHDNIRHDPCPILGGAWGGKVEYTKKFNFTNTIQQWILDTDPNFERRGLDQHYLKMILFPAILRDNEYYSSGVCPILDKMYNLVTHKIEDHKPYLIDRLTFIGERNEKCIECNKFNTKMGIDNQGCCRFCNIDSVSKKWNFEYFSNKFIKKYVIVKSVDGLGSNIATLLAAKKLAEITNRTLYVDWRDTMYSDGIVNYYSELFNDNNQDIQLSHFDNMTFFPEMWSTIGHKTMIEDITKNYDKNLLNKLFNPSYHQLVTTDADVIIICNRIYHKNIPEESRWTIMKSMKPSQPIVDSLNTINLDQIVKIGIHYRHGNGELKGIRNVDLITEYFYVCDKILTKEPLAFLFVCTDNKDILHKFQHKYKGRVLSIDKWYPQANIGGRMHGHPDCPSPIENAKNAMKDIYMLSKCNYLIYPKTYFSLIAEYWGNFNKHQLFYINCTK
jgi:hypothetical protein